MQRMSKLCELSIMVTSSRDGINDRTLMCPIRIGGRGAGRSLPAPPPVTAGARSGRLRRGRRPGQASTRGAAGPADAGTRQASLSSRCRRSRQRRPARHPRCVPLLPACRRSVSRRAAPPAAPSRHDLRSDLACQTGRKVGGPHRPKPGPSEALSPVYLFPLR